MFCQDVVTLPQGRLYNVNVLTQRMFPSGPTPKVDKSILLKNNLLDYTLFIPKDDGQELVFVCFKSQRKAYSHMVTPLRESQEIDLAPIYLLL